METKRIDITEIVPNTGQVHGLPRNPRQWTQAELKALEKSISETPELLEARGLIVIKSEDKYVTLGGNMRLAAAVGLGLKTVPCIVLPENTPTRKLKEIAIKDNCSFGEWDKICLVEDFGDLNLDDWNIPFKKWENADSFSELCEKAEKTYLIQIHFDSEIEMNKAYGELSKNYEKCDILIY